MENTVIILLMFASLARSTYVPKLVVTYDLPEEKTAVLENILVNQEIVKVVKADGYNLFLDVIRELTAALIAGSDTTAEIDTSKFDEALCTVKNGTDLVFASILLALEGCSSACSAVEIARNETYNYIEDLFATMISTLNLAISCESYSDIETSIADNRDAVLEDFTNIINSVYDSILACLDTTDSDILNLIEAARTGSLLSISHLTDAIFNGIKVYAAAASGTYPYATLTCDIEIFQSKAIVAHRDIAEHIFVTLRAIFINSNLNQSGIVACVAGSQYIAAVSHRSYWDGNINLFKRLTDSLQRIRLGLGDDGQDYFSQDDISLETLVKQFDVGDFAINDYLLYMHPSAAVSLVSLRELIHTYNVAGDVAFFDAINAAENKSLSLSAATEMIEAARHAGVDPAPEYTDLFFNAVRDNITFDEEIGAKLVYLQNLTIYGAQVSTTSFFDGVLVLANATRSGEVCEADFSALDTILAEAIVALEYFCQGLASAGLLVCRTIYGN